MRRAVTIVLLALSAAACGGGSKDTGSTTTTRAASRAPSLTTAADRTLAAGTAGLRQTTAIVVGGSRIEAHDTGRITFDGRRAHLYKLNPGSNVPGEVIVDGPITYSNANAQAALSSAAVRPWTRLDTRAVSAQAKKNKPDELSHVLVPAYLAYGARAVLLARHVGDGALYWARIDPALVLRRVPPPRRALVAKALRGDYPRSQFNAKLWIDGRDRIRRVIIAYQTADGTPVAIDTSYDRFGAPVDVTPPPARDVKDITPR
ncbi:MAG: hypothetical protein ACJ77E_14080 [Gaiellaceae bacterium]